MFNFVTRRPDSRDFRNGAGSAFAFLMVALEHIRAHYVNSETIRKTLRIIAVIRFVNVSDNLVWLFSRDYDMRGQRRSSVGKSTQ